MKMSRKMEAALEQAVRPGVRIYMVHKLPGDAAARIHVGNEGTLRLAGRAVRGRVVAKDTDVLLFQTKKAVRRKRAKHPAVVATARKRVARRKKRKAKKRAK